MSYTEKVIGKKSIPKMLAESNLYDWLDDDLPLPVVSEVPPDAFTLEMLMRDKGISESFARSRIKQGKAAGEIEVFCRLRTSNGNLPLVYRKCQKPRQ